MGLVDVPVARRPCFYENFESVAKRNTVDLRAMFQGIGAEHQG
jgi:hypothetical protein